MKRIFLSCAESSGDQAAALLAQGLRAHSEAPPLCLCGVGGERLTPHLNEPWFSSQDLAVSGASAVLATLPRLLQRYHDLRSRLIHTPPDLAILVDAPDWHARIAALCRRLKIPVLWVVAPQTWAWRAGRVNRFRHRMDRLAVVLPFEENYFARLGFASRFVGHPQLEFPSPRFSTEEAQPGFWLLPGSRSHEIDRNLPLFLDIHRRVNENRGTSWPAFVQTTAEQQARVREWVQGKAQVGLDFPSERPSCCLCSVGTATLLPARAEVPTVLVHRQSSLDTFVAERLVYQRLFALPDVISAAPLTPQFIRGEHAALIAARVADFLTDDTAKTQQREGYAEALRRLGARRFSLESAAMALELLTPKKETNDVHTDEDQETRIENLRSGLACHATCDEFGHGVTLDGRRGGG